MTQHDSALPELLAALQAGDGVDLVRELARWALQELIEPDATPPTGAARSASPSCGPAASSRRCSSRAAASTRRCTR